MIFLFWIACFVISCWLGWLNQDGEYGKALPALLFVVSAWLGIELARRQATPSPPPDAGVGEPEPEPEPTANPEPEPEPAPAANPEPEPDDGDVTIGMEAFAASTRRVITDSKNAAARRAWTDGFADREKTRQSGAKV